MQPSTEIMAYQNHHVTDNDVPIVTSIRPPTTAGQRSKRMIAVVAAGIMLLAGVVLMQDDGSSYNHLSRSVVTENGSIASIAEELVVATQLSTEEEGEDKLADCYADGHGCTAFDGDCNNCCNSYHVGPTGLDNYCGRQTSCWGKGTYCVPEVGSCGKCCNSWSWYFTVAYCD